MINTTKEEVLKYFINHVDNYYQDADDSMLVNLIICKAKELIEQDTEYWANNSMKKLRQIVEDLLVADNPNILDADYFYKDAIQ